MMAAFAQYPFMVADRPFCVWGWDLEKENLDFIDSLDPKYLDSLRSTLKTQIDEDGNQHAAVALRMMYSQALETFFAVLFAAFQAPHQLAAWLVKYQPGDVRKLIRLVNNGSSFVSNVLLEAVSWKDLCRTVHSSAANQQKVRPMVETGIAPMWERYAIDYLNEDLNREFNSIKHGLRVRPGGFCFQIWGPDANKDGPPTLDLGSSDFGTKYPSPQGLSGTNFNFLLQNQHVYWSPENLSVGLEGLVMSIHNVLSFLQVELGHPGPDLVFKLPDSQEDCMEPWKPLQAPSTMVEDRRIPDGCEVLSKEEIRARFEPRVKGGN